LVITDLREAPQGDEPVIDNCRIEIKAERAAAKPKKKTKQKNN